MGRRPLRPADRLHCTVDLLIWVDRIDGVIVCGGCSGHAFKFGPLLGRLIADLAQGRPLPPEADRFRASRLAPA